MIIMLLPDLLTLIPIYLWHNNAQHRCRYCVIRVLPKEPYSPAKKFWFTRFLNTTPIWRSVKSTEI